LEKPVPVLFDKKTGHIVNDESPGILRLMDSAFDDLIPKNVLKLVPPSLEHQIDGWNAWIYTTINNGAYKAGFAGTQEAYEIGYENFFQALDLINDHLRHRTPLLTENARLFQALFRFDHVYYIRLKLNKKMFNG